MALIEKLGSFYLGKEYDLASQQRLERSVNYDSRDLTTHAVCVGMTGSGKTGLCIDLLEEAALDSVPALIIDPKGDITNLLLTFPDLLPEDFRPWINEDDARRKGLTPESYAAQVAQTWRNGLAEWDQGPERIRMLKDAADFAIYTPGSEAGLPISILSSFQAPQLDWESESEALRERIQGTVSALLGLIGVDADPLRSREHILLSNILENAWRAGTDLDIASLILAVQKPPFNKLGVFDLNTFFPEKDRFTLAVMLNNIIASPGFAAWTEGEPLDIGSLLHTPAGKPRHSIFYIAHLNDAERMFFVTILLEQVITWMRAQPGTTSLRAILYMDEVFGFFPPVAEPPSKRPMLTLLKQARAFGLGVMLTTQNPVDVDYRGLTNAGTWFIGKLQAERDKTRLMDGLKSAIAEAGSLADPALLDKLISSLDNRVFLMHDVHLSAPVVFNTRWAMSYLRGPLTKQQVKQISASRKVEAPAAAPQAAGGQAAEMVKTAAPQVEIPSGLSVHPPVLPPSVKQMFLPVGLDREPAMESVSGRTGRGITAEGARLVYEPGLIGFATARFLDRKSGLDEGQDYGLLLPFGQAAGHISWKDAERVDLQPSDLEDRPEADALFVTDLADDVADARSMNRMSSDLADHLYRNEVYRLAYNRTLKLYAGPRESERDFRVRCQQAAREARDAAVDKLRDKYDAQVERIEEKLRREQQTLSESQEEYKGRQREEVLSGLSSVVGALGLFGRRSRSTRGLSTMATKRRMTSAAKAEIAESEADIARLQAQIEEIKGQMEEEANAITQQWSDAVDDIQELRISPRKTDIRVEMFSVAWIPYWEVSYRDAQGRSRAEAVPGYRRP